MDKILVDTSAWIDFLTLPQADASKILGRLLDRDAVCITGVVLAELLHGSRSDQEAGFLLSKFQPLEFLEATREVWVKTGRMASELRRRGMRVPLSDILIAAVAQANDCPLYTIDAHFSRIPHLKLYRP